MIHAEQNERINFAKYKQIKDSEYTELAMNVKDGLEIYILENPAGDPFKYSMYMISLDMPAAPLNGEFAIIYSYRHGDDLGALLLSASAQLYEELI